MQAQYVRIAMDINAQMHMEIFMETIKAHATLTYNPGKMMFLDGVNIALILSDSSGSILNIIIDAHSSGIVSREKISHSLWPGKHNIDYSAALNQRIYKLRKELANIGLNEVVITVPGEGYQINDDFLSLVDFHTPPKKSRQERYGIDKRSLVVFILLLILLSLWAF